LESTPESPFLPKLKKGLLIIKDLNHKIELGVFTAVFLFVIFSLVIDMLYRTFVGGSILDLNTFTRYLMIILTGAAAALTSKQHEHMGMALPIDKLPGKLPTILRAISSFSAIVISAALFLASVGFALSAFTPDQMILFLPQQFFALILSYYFLVILVRWIVQIKPRILRWSAILAIPLGFFLTLPSFYNISFPLGIELPIWFLDLELFWYDVMPVLSVIGVVFLIAQALTGLPIYIILGGIAVLLFAQTGYGSDVIALKGFNLLNNNVTPAIALFSLSGFFLSESKASNRLLNLASSSFSWIRGGMSIAAIVAMAFFGAFTGASGVTILAMGGLLFSILHKKAGYPESLVSGLVTSSGSIGILFFPSLAIILYASTAQIPIIGLFVGAFIPFILRIVAVSILSLVQAKKLGIQKEKFDGKKLFLALKEAIPELGLGLLIILGFTTRFALINEIAAFSVAYTIIIYVFVKKEIKIRAIPHIMLKAGSIIGGVLIILFAARGFNEYLIDSFAAQQITEWVSSAISSPIIFLLILNVILLVTGCIMDIFSAIIVVAPLIIPLALSYGIEPVHLGVLFITNLELGYITPPVGINLFLSSYRLEQPLTRIYRDVLPFLAVQFVVVIIVTFLPQISAGIASLVQF
jgi:C4-dicarboxylate transporter DctM subunit